MPCFQVSFNDRKNVRILISGDQSKVLHCLVLSKELTRYNNYSISVYYMTWLVSNVECPLRIIL